MAVNRSSEENIDVYFNIIFQVFYMRMDLAQTVTNNAGELGFGFNSS